MEPFDDDPGTEPARESVARLREQFRSYHGLLRQLHDLPPEDPDLPEEPKALSFHSAAGVECDPGVKQRLLAERSTARRVEALLLLIPVLASGVESNLRVHRRAHGNGRGTGQPDLLGGV